VHRLDRAGNPRAYPGPRVYWLESYATAGRDTVAPNEMWRRRTRGQLDKCAEAAALRAAFPEELGNDYAAEEMEGQVVDHAPSDEPVAKAPPLRGNAALRSRLTPEPPPEEDEPEDDSPAPDEPETLAGDDDHLRRLHHPPPVAATPGAGVTPARRGRPRKPPEPTDEEIERSQDMLAAVLSPEELQLDEQSLDEIEVIKPQRLPRDRGWDWPLYADDLIAAGLRTPQSHLGRFRGANSSLFDVLRASNKPEWERVNQALADYEREGAR
jgi:hypothetical protein